MASHVDDTWKTMWVTHGKPCVNMHDTFESYKYGSSNSVRGESSKEKEKKGKSEREERKREKEERRRERKGKKKREEERGKE